MNRSEYDAMIEEYKLTKAENELLIARNIKLKETIRALERQLCPREN